MAVKLFVLTTIIVAAPGPGKAQTLVEQVGEDIYYGRRADLRSAAAAGTLGSPEDRALWHGAMRWAINRLKQGVLPQSTQLFRGALLEAYLSGNELTPNLSELLRLAPAQVRDELQRLPRVPRVLWLSGAISGVPAARASIRSTVRSALPREDLSSPEVEQVARLSTALLVRSTPPDRAVLRSALGCGTPVCRSIHRNVAVLEGRIRPWRGLEELYGVLGPVKVTPAYLIPRRPRSRQTRRVSEVQTPPASR